MTQFFCQEFKGTVEAEGAPFRITVWTSHETINKECTELFSNKPKLLKVVKCRKSIANIVNGTTTPNHFNHSSVQRAVDELGDELIDKVKLECPTTPYVLDRIECLMDSLYLVGRYNKFARNISQTPWLIEGSKITTSVQELIAEFVVKHIPAECKPNYQDTNRMCNVLILMLFSFFI